MRKLFASVRPSVHLLACLALIVAACPDDPKEDVLVPKEVDTADTADSGDGVEPDGDSEVGPDVEDAETEVETETPCTEDNECAGVFTGLSACEEGYCTNNGVCGVRDIDGCCETATDCAASDFPDKTVCQELACEANVCVVNDIADCCENDAACQDQATNCCEDAVCDPLTRKCVVSELADCCGGTSVECDDGNPATNDVCETSCVANGCLHQAPICEVNQIYLQRRFDDGTVQTMKTTDPMPADNVKWHTTTVTSVSPPYSVHLGDTACGTYYNGEMAACVPTDPLQGESTSLNVQLETQEVGLDPEVGTFLGFYVRMSAEPAFPGDDTLPQIDIDYLQVTIIDSSGSEEVWRSTEAFGVANTTNGQWMYQTVNLSKWAGKGVKVRFTFIADTTGNYGPAGKPPYEGVYLDDITIQATCQNAYCDSNDPSCVPDGSGCTADTCTMYANAAGGVCGYQRAPTAFGKPCKPCGQAADCGTDSCKDYACVDNVCDVNLKAECCEPNTTFPLVTQAPAVDAEGFETTDLSLWAKDDPFPNDNIGWQVDTTNAFQGTTSMYFGDPSTLTYEAVAAGGGPNPAVATIYTPPFPVAEVDFRTPIATFWLWMSTEYDGTSGPNPGEPYDQLKVLIKTQADAEPVEVWESATTIGNSTNGTWYQVGIDLSAWSGSSVRLGFAFDSGEPPGTGIGNDYEGVRIDDLAVTNVCGADPCLGTASCDDGDFCTSDWCDLGTCANVKEDPYCCQTVADCDDGNDCTTQACVNDSCQFEYAADVGSCCSEGPWVETQKITFEKDLGGIVVDTVTPPVTWHASTKRAASGAKSLNFGDPVAGSYQISGQVTEGAFTTPPVMVPPYGSGQSFVEFDLFLQTEWDTSVDPFIPLFDYIDELQVFVSVDEVVSDEPVWTSHYTQNSTFGSWIHTRADLTDYAGQTVQLVFQFSSGDKSNNQYQGPFIDNLDYGTTCANPATVDCLNGSDCASADSCELPQCTADFQCTISAKPTADCCEPAPVPELSNDFEGSAPISGWEKVTCDTNNPNVFGAVLDTASVWQVTNSSGTGGIPPQQGTKFLYFGNGTDYGGNSKGACQSATTPEIALDPDLPWTLAMWMYLDIEPDPSCGDPGQYAPWADHFEVRLLTTTAQGQVSEKVLFDKSDIACDEFGSWAEMTFDLSAYAGQTVQIQFDFNTYDYVQNDGKGIAIDDLRVIKGCVTQQP